MAKILIRKPRKTHVEELGKDVLLGPFEKFYVKKTDKDFSEKRGQVPKEELASKPHCFTVGKESYFTLDSDFLDDYKQLKRHAQIIGLKDIGRIITLLGIHKESVIVESGAGSGAATCYLASVAKQVYTYEINDENLSVTQENIKCYGLENVDLRKGDIYADVEAHEADAFLLDVPEPVKALPQVHKALRMGGRVAIYTPNLTQAQELILTLGKEFLYEETIELTERNWVIKDRILRPQMQGLGHTAFLTLLRKIPKN